MEELKNPNLVFSVLFEMAKSAWLVTNRLLLFLPPAVLIYLFYILLLNSSRGFDITDESYYVLWASQPEHVIASTTQFGYYTGLLYLLSGKNIVVFRIIGILMLTGTAGFFAVALENYWAASADKVLNTRKFWKIITLISICTLAYYKSWLITPSYNWLALLSVLIVGTGLLRATTDNPRNRVLSRSQSNIFSDGLIVGLGGGLAFMAKPTSALVLALIALFWTGVHPLRRNSILFFIVAIFASSLFLLMHAVVFKGGIMPFYYELREGTKISSILWEGHSIGSIFEQTVYNFKQVPAHIFRMAPIGFLIFPVVLWLVWWMKRRGHVTVAIISHSIFLIIFNLFIWYRLWETSHWNRISIGLGGISFLFALLLSAVLTYCVWKKSTGEDGLIALKRVVILNVFLFMLAVAMAFGSAVGIIRQMSFAYVFLGVGAIYTAFWIDQYVGRKTLGSIVPVLVSFSVLIVIMLAFKSPYRLPGKISEQVVESSFLSNTSSLKVDPLTAVYLSDLKRIAQEAGWEPGTPLIDLTGGSPGASVILGGRIMGSPWLIGGYKGSNEFVATVLRKIPRQVQNISWVLTAPEGTRSLSNKILSEIDLNFPGEYIAVGKVRTGHRNELQILWKPLSDSSPSGKHPN